MMTDKLGNMHEYFARKIKERRGRGKRLAFAMQEQQETNWCWAAASASVASHYDKATTWSQCGIAGTLLGRDCCGNDEDPHPCNETARLDEALSIVGCLARMSNQDEEPQAVVTEIAAGRPMCIRIGWHGGGGHFIAITGWYLAADGSTVYWVDDPKYGPERVTARKLATRYRLGGSWTHSYFTADPAAGGAAAIDTAAFDPDAIGG